MATASDQFKIKGLREQRGKIREEIQKIGLKIVQENRAMSPEEKGAFDKLKADFVTVNEAVRATEATLREMDDLVAAASNEELAAPAETPAEPVQNSKRVPGRQDRTARPRGDGASLAERANDLRLCRQAWARRQFKLAPTKAQREAVERTGFNLNRRELDIRLGNPAGRRDRFEKRALSVTTTAGGYLIAEDYSYELEQKLVEFTDLRGVCRELQTANGADLPWPTEDDTSNSGELLGINTEVAYADPSFASITFGAYKFSSKGVLVPTELIQDAAFDVDSLVFGEIGTRIGRAQATYFTTGTGTSQPKGIVTCSSLGVTTSSGTAFTAPELTRLAHSVDPAYRKSGSCGYMMKDDTLAYALLLVDGESRPFLRDSYKDGVGNMTTFTCNGFPIYVNQAMTGMTTNAPVSAAKHVLFGDFQKFVIRDAGSVRLRRLDERYAEKDQVGFIGFLRSDSNCVNTAAIKHLLQA